jgi:hypothetical protein
MGRRLQVLRQIGYADRLKLETTNSGFGFVSLAFFARHPAAYRAFAYVGFQHGVVGGAGAAKLFARNNMPYVDHDESQAEKAENHGKHEEEFHKSEFEGEINAY